MAQTPDTAASPIRLRLNLPATRIDVLWNDRVTETFPVAIGQPEFPTPTGTYQVTTTEWNPWWVPPAHEWAARDTVQPPGPSNPMGRVKLYFRAFYFLHGTPDSGSVGQAASHGCVRLRNDDAVRLALAVVRAGVPDIEPERLAALVRNRTTTMTIPLDRPVPIAIVYALVEWDRLAGAFLLHPNYYNRPTAEAEAQLFRILAAQGRRGDTTAVRRWLNPTPARTATEVVPVDSLVRRLAPR